MEFFPALCRVYCTACIRVLAFRGVNDVCPGPALLDWIALSSECRLPVVSGNRQRCGEACFSHLG